MKEILPIINKLILPLSLLINIELIYQITTIPDKISSQLYGKYKDTVSVTVTKTADIGQKGSFIWFEGTVISETKNLKNQYGYNVDYPMEMYQGYYSLAEHYTGAKYLLWSKTGGNINGSKIEGWFLSVNTGKFQEGSGYYDILFPFSVSTTLNFNP